MDMILTKAQIIALGRAAEGEFSATGSNTDMVVETTNLHNGQTIALHTSANPNRVILVSDKGQTQGLFS